MCVWCCACVRAHAGGHFKAGAQGSALAAETCRGRARTHRDVDGGRDQDVQVAGHGLHLSIKPKHLAGQLRGDAGRRERARRLRGAVGVCGGGGRAAAAARGGSTRGLSIRNSRYGRCAAMAGRWKFIQACLALLWLVFEPPVAVARSAPHTPAKRCRLGIGAFRLRALEGRAESVRGRVRLLVGASLAIRGRARQRKRKRQHERARDLCAARHEGSSSVSPGRSDSSGWCGQRQSGNWPESCLWASSWPLVWEIEGEICIGSLAAL